MRKPIIALLAASLAAPAFAQPLPPVPAPQMVPKPAAVTKGPYQPQALLPGGIVMPLWPAGSPYLNAKRVSEAEVYTMDPVVAGRVERMVNIHNPSIEVHLAVAGNNTGTAIILAPGGGHTTLVVGLEGTDPVPYFFEYGINTIILRNRHRPCPCRGMAYRSAQDRGHGLFRRRRTDHGGGDPVSRFRRQE
jgi:endo-1,4-beta-xylanase